MTEAQPVEAIEVRNIDDVTREVRLVIPAETITSEKKKKLTKLQKTAKVDGFRKNRVPLHIVERMYGQSAMAEVVEHQCWEVWQQAAKKNDLKPIGMPKFEIAEFKHNQPIDFSVYYEIMPEIILADYSEIRLDKEESTVVQEDVDNTIKNILSNHMHWHTVERPSQQGDIVVAHLDYSIRVDDAAEPVLQSNKDERLLLDEKFALPALMSQLIGVRGSDKLACDITLPDDFPNPAWQGKAAHFDIEVKHIEQPSEAVLDDDFARKMGIAEGVENPVDAFREQVRKNMEYELQGAVKKNFRDALLTKVLEKTDVPVPKTVEDYFNRMLRRNLAQQYIEPEKLKQYGKSPEDALPAEGFVDGAKRDASVSLLLEEIERQRDMQVIDEEMRVVAEELSVQYDDPEKYINQLLQDKNSADQIRRIATEDKVIRWLETQVHVTAVKKSYEEIMNSKPELTKDQSEHPAIQNEGVNS